MSNESGTIEVGLEGLEISEGVRGAVQRRPMCFSGYVDVAMDVVFGCVTSRGARCSERVKKVERVPGGVC